MAGSAGRLDADLMLIIFFSRSFIAFMSLAFSSVIVLCFRGRGGMIADREDFIEALELPNVGIPPLLVCGLGISLLRSTGSFSGMGIVDARNVILGIPTSSCIRYDSALSLGAVLSMDFPLLAPFEKGLKPAGIVETGRKRPDAVRGRPL
jgi:hypothetical protein